MKHFLLFLSFLTLVACGEKSLPEKSSTLKVNTSFYPLTYFSEKIGGEWVDVQCPVPEGEDPIFWKPDEKEFKNILQADCIVLNGAEFEKWALQMSLPISKTLRSAQSFKSRFILYEKATTHQHGGSSHTHQGIDGHTWLDPLSALEQSQNIKNKFLDFLKEPQQQKDLEQNFSLLEKDLRELHQEFQQLKPSLKDIKLLASHPAYNYISQRYSIPITNFDFDPETPFTPVQVQQLKLELSPTQRVVLLWESQPLKEHEQALSDLGILSLVFSPCESLSSDEQQQGMDYMKIMKRNLKSLRSLIE